MKKHLLLLLGALLTLPSFARDFTYTYEGQTLKYTVLYEVAKTVKTKEGSSPNPGNNVSGDLILPSKVFDGETEYTLTEIGNNAFYDCSGLTSVVIPNSVIFIGRDAFSGCISLERINVEEENKNYCSVDGVLFNFDKTTLMQCPTKKNGQYIIPNSVASIGYYAFEMCSGLTSVVIPNSVASIGYYAFEMCSGLTSVVIPNSVTSIGEGAFYGCCGLTSVEIGKSVETIGKYAFFGCSGLTSIEIPNSVITIGNSAFSGCSGLTMIGIPNSVTAIGNGAFYGCSGLTSIEIPNSVTSICGFAFYNCSGLTSVVIPNSVTQIGYDAFYGCSGLTSIEIPTSVTSIGDDAFYGCSGLTSIEIPTSVTSIGDDAFYGCSGLTSVTIPNSVTSIGNHTFRGCSGLISVEIPNSVTTIGDHAFSSCSGLTSVVIPNSVTSIGSFAFSGCSGLTSVEIPNSVTSIGSFAFGGCSGLTSVEIGKSVETIGNNAFYGCRGLTSVVIGKSVETIGNYAFYDCSGLTSIEIPNSVASIGEEAFCHCRNLTSVVIPNSVNSIDERAFEDCSGLKLVEIEGDRVLGINDVFDKTYSINILVPKSVIADYRLQYPDFKFISDNDLNFVYSGEGDNFGIEEKDSAILTLSLDNADIVNGFQTDITLPAGLAIAEKDGALEVYFGYGTASASHTISASKVDGENKYRIVAYSSKNEVFKSGEYLLNINLVSDENLKGGEITLDNTVMSLIGEISCHPDAVTIPVTVAEPLYGDANDNGIVAIDDVVTDVQYILEKNPTPFSFKKADVNRDNVINVIDVSKTVGIILSNDPANAPRRAPGLGLSASIPGLYADVVNDAPGRKTMVVSLDNRPDITALQGDIDLPEGINITGISLAGAQQGSHRVDYAYIKDNTVRFVVYSLSLARMDGNAPMIEVALECDSSATDSNVELYDVKASDVNSNLLNFDALSVGVSNGTTTGIGEISADDEAPRYFLINGVEVKDATTPGIYIVRRGDKVEKLVIK